MATIEPRLMHLLNDSNSPETSAYPAPDLPPIQSFSSFAKSSNFSLPPLELDASHHGRSEQQPSSSSRASQHIPPLASITEEYNGRYPDGGGLRHTGGGISLRMLYDNPEVNESQLSLNHILDDVPEPSLSTEDATTKKRQRALTVKDDIMHLPQPLKKQKSAQNIVPPIINGLYEPPPNAAVFPPIALEDNDPATNINTFREFNNALMNNPEPEACEKVAVPTPLQEQTTVPEADKALPKVKRKAAKPRRKWSEEETRDLLLGVDKYGVGKWTSILEDPAYNFNGRTAGDLKDRFRTCCPDELRVSHSKSKESLYQEHSASAPPTEAKSKGKSKTALLLEDILADPEELENTPGKEDAPCTSSSPGQPNQQDSDSTAKPKKSRAHRKKLEDLQKMGIHGPFKKSHRRERRPFTQQDDDQILEGLRLYGPAWTKIQRDPRFDLSSRQPTDLRDRVRNKYPDTYKQIEERQIQAKDPGPSRTSSNLMEPSVNTMMNENSLMTLEPHLNRSGSREDMMVHKWSGAQTLPHASTAVNNSFTELPGLDSFTREQTLDGEMGDVGEQSNSTAFIGNLEAMDISRLLLD
ncbi:hypothetical protein VSDG_05566 [Cytospora chrysosperma]|uniref:Myb-like domain-containing protein n=1 Tax=Cytospora chrysosperma TaxID=252740 RepID=A0A423W0D4_CYTCH|nr:hypothetical protein VSDG_05566 [Valsa sordida]